MWRPNVSYEMVGACGSLMPNVNIRMEKNRNCLLSFTTFYLTIDFNIK